MRVMARISMPVESGNRAIKDGTLPAVVQRATERWKPEAMYFTTFDGQRTAYVVFDLLFLDGRPLVGLAWHTRAGKTGRRRSIDLPGLEPLFSAAKVRWISLQYGEHAALAAQAEAAQAPILIDPSVDQFCDIDRFAAQVAALDLVITIDNSTAHLAAALGIPTWLLLPFVPNWRWLLATDRSPWYPSLRIFRQAKPGDWSRPLLEIRAALLSWALPRSR